MDLETPHLDLIQIQKKLVEKGTALGLSWDTAVQLQTLAALTEVSSQVARLSKVLAEILAEANQQDNARRNTSTSPASGGADEAGYGSASPGSPKRVGRPPGRPPKNSGADSERKPS